MPAPERSELEETVLGTKKKLNYSLLFLLLRYKVFKSNKTSVTDVYIICKQVCILQPMMQLTYLEDRGNLREY